MWDGDRGAQDLSQGGYGGGASQTALVSSVSCPTGGGGLLAELSRRQGQSQMETDGWEGDATAVVRPSARQPLCGAYAAQALSLLVAALPSTGFRFSNLVASSRQLPGCHRIHQGAMCRAQSIRVLTWHAACGQGNGWADRTMYGGEEPGSSPPASHLSAPRAYMPPDSSMSEGTYSTQPGAPSASGTAPPMLLHVIRF